MGLHHQEHPRPDHHLPGPGRHRRGLGSATTRPNCTCKDTLEAGVGLCDEEAVRVLVEEGPARVRELERLGTKFDRRDGKLILGSEGAHSVPRVVHAGGDATGSVVASALAEAIISGSRVELHENEFVHRPAHGRRAAA